MSKGTYFILQEMVNNTSISSGTSISHVSCRTANQTRNTGVSGLNQISDPATDTGLHQNPPIFDRWSSPPLPKQTQNSVAPCDSRPGAASANNMQHIGSCQNFATNQVPNTLPQYRATEALGIVPRNRYLFKCVSL